MLASFLNGPYILFLIWRHNLIKLLHASTTVHWLAKHYRHKMGTNSNWNYKRSMHNAVMCTLSLCDVIGITRHLHIKLKSFSNIAQHLHKETIRGCSFLYIISKKSVIMSEAFLVDVCIYCTLYTFSSHVKVLLSKDNLFKKTHLTSLQLVIGTVWRW